jgi:inosose dehydratase
MQVSRRVVLQAAMAGTTWAAALPVAAAGSASAGAGAGVAGEALKLGVATYSFRRLTVEQAIKALVRLNLKYASIKDMHLAMRSTTEQRKEVLDKFKAAGITLLSAGVIYLTNDEAACRNAFEYARDLALPVMVISPQRDSLRLVEKLAREFNIRQAIHNHGPEDTLWATPSAVMQDIKDLDERMGLCIDAGHSARAGEDPAEAIEKYKDRLFDFHIKDVASLSARNASGEVEIGRGVLKIRAILDALIKIKFAGHVGIEHEKDAGDPVPGVAESVGYLRGVMHG